jgi:hypothetical protein
MTRHRALAAGTMLVFATSACSFITLRRPPAADIERPANVECTESVAAPVVDTAIALTYVALGMFVLAKGGTGCCSGPECFGGCPSGMAVGGLIGGAIFGASAVYGFTMTNRCRGIVRPQPPEAR